MRCDAMQRMSENGTKIGSRIASYQNHSFAALSLPLAQLIETAALAYMLRPLSIIGADGLTQVIPIGDLREPILP